MPFRLPRTLSIRSRLLLTFALVVALTSATITGVTAVIQSREARDRVVGHLQSVATLKEQEIDSWTRQLGLNLDFVISTEGATRDLRTLVVATPGSGPYQAAYDRMLSRFTWVSRRGLFEEVFFMDQEGEVLVSTDRGHERQQLGMNDYFTEGVDGRFIQEPSYAPSLEKMTVVASRPVRRDGTSFGVLAGRADLAGLNEVMIGRAGLGKTGETYLVGSNHRLLTALRLPGYEIPNAYVRTFGTDAAVDRNQRGFSTYEGYAGAAVVGVYRWIPRLKVALLAEQGEAEAFRVTRLTLWTMGGISALATVFAIVAGIVLIHGIVRPLSELGDTAGRIADGELDLDARVVREDEIGKLARSFNRMTGRLRDLVRSLQKRTDHLRAINETGTQISSVLDLDELLPEVAHSLLRTFGYDRVAILLVEEDGMGRLLTCSSEDERACETELRKLDEMPELASVVASSEPLVRTPGIGEGAPGEVASEIAVPIRIGDTVAGALDITAGSAHPLDEQDLFTARTLADQLAVAVENSRLYENARELAASRERQRLARDLHDAVSQTLFSVSIMAEVLPRIYEKDPEEGRRRLEELRQLTRGALAEMRILLLELRPAALNDTSLPDLLRQLTESVIGRARIPVELRIETGRDLPAEVGVPLYRIAQEALHNVAKHSGAGQAAVILRDLTTAAVDAGRGGEPPGVELIVRDDGCGFDGEARSGRLGLGIMAERAETIGAELHIDSEPGDGTTVRVVWAPG